MYTEERKNALLENIFYHFRAISSCIDNGYWMPALILIYTGIDIFASLGRPSGQNDVTRKDYIQWCERYLIPSGKLPCSAIDLYAARCGVVHTYTPHSSLSRNGNACEIYYALGDRRPEDLQPAIDELGYTRRVIHIETLAEVFFYGAEKFALELDSDSNMTDLVVSRAGKLFSHVS